MRWTLDYAPFLLAGLLRWRLKEPKALIVGIDQLADKLLSAVEYTERKLLNIRHLSPRLANKRE